MPTRKMGDKIRLKWVTCNYCGKQYRKFAEDVHATNYCNQQCWGAYRKGRVVMIDSVTHSSAH